ncbi:MAG: FAD-binding protein [Acidimicrobiia bacterium]|nr:FAD-binding protein [Acidimicrobiia bacterium]
MASEGFTNWGGNYHCDPAQILSPADTEEIAEVVRAARCRGERVKAVGSGHSFTDGASTDGSMIRLNDMTRFHGVDPDTGVATVDAGITLRALSEELDRVGRALPNMGDIDVQTLAGATATATHGTGAQFPNLSAGIVGFEIVTGTGEVLWCDAGQNADIWRVGRVNLGALGVITRIALETVPAFALEQTEGVEQIDGLVKDFAGFVANVQHPEFFWFPGSERALVKRNQPTTQVPNPPSLVAYGLHKYVLENRAFELALRGARRFPGQRVRIRNFVEAMAGSSHTVDKSYRIFSSPRLVRFVEMEYGIPVDAVPEAIEQVRRFTDTLDAPPLFPIEVRVSAADDIPLSTAYGRDTGWLAFHQYRGMEYERYFRGIEEIMDGFNGRPHWGKLHYQNAEALRSRYPEWDSFQQVRDLVDPTGMFRNSYLDRVLGWPER